MKPSRVRILLLALLPLSACRDEPLAPAASSLIDPLDPVMDILVIRHGGTAELPPLQGDSEAFPRAVNRRGEVVGASGGRAALWTPASRFSSSGPEETVTRDLSPLEHAVAIDDEGRVVGERNGRAAMWVDGAITDLGALPGHDRSSPLAGSSTGGIVVGNSWPSASDFDAVARGFRWASGALTELGPLPGDESSRGLWVNGAGTVVGLSYAPGHGRGLIVVWDAEGGGDEEAVPTSTDYDFLTHAPLGISDEGDVLIAARDGNEVVTWRSGAVREHPHPTPDAPGARFWGLKISADGTILFKVEVDEPLVDYRIGTVSGSDFVSISPSPVSECPFFDASTAICFSDTRDHYFTALVGERKLPDGVVEDLTVTEWDETSITLRWTQVDDGRGRPARYRVRYSPAPIHTDAWSTASFGCDVRGDEIGAEASCTVRGLEPHTPYDFQLMSYRVEDGRWVGAKSSNVGVGEAGADGSPPLPPDPEPNPVRVTDLAASGTTESSVTLEWTQVDDGAGDPAWYRLRYSEAPLVAWKNATLGCDRTIRGDEIGAGISCTVDGLASGTTYEFQLMSYRMEDGVWVDARYSNVAAAATMP